MFWIGFTDEQLVEVEPGEEGRVGLLVLGNHEEHFVAHLPTWSEKQYLDHWKAALARVLLGKPSALVTEMLTPIQSNHLIWWPVWKIDGALVFHNQLFFFKQHKIHLPQVNVDELYELIGEHSSCDEEGSPLSEWRVPVSDIKDFLAKN